MSGADGLMRMHAARWPGVISVSTGSMRLQASTAYGQRVWKRHPDGGLSGDGTSPWSTTRCRRRSRTGLGTGTAEINAFVYGMSGRS